MEENFILIVKVIKICCTHNNLNRHSNITNFKVKLNYTESPTKHLFYFKSFQ